MEAYGDESTDNLALEGWDVTLYLNSVLGTFNGNAGINSYWGRYELNETTITYPEGLAITSAGGPEIVMQQESVYINIFSLSDTCEVIDGKLHITGGDGWIIFHRK
jgi:heat shock protein HslJ